MKVYLLLLLPLICLGSCNGCKHEKEIPAGGPCTYKEEVHPAKLIRLQTTDSLNYDGQFEVQRGLQPANIADTVFFHFLNNTYIKVEHIKKDSIEVGKIYKLVEQSILSGSCNPHIQTIRLEKY
jgi:hypothetical protein